MQCGIRDVCNLSLYRICYTRQSLWISNVNTLDFIYPHYQKSERVRSGDRGNYGKKNDLKCWDHQNDVPGPCEQTLLCMKQHPPTKRHHLAHFAEEILVLHSFAAWLYNGRLLHSMLQNPLVSFSQKSIGRKQLCL